MSYQKLTNEIASIEAALNLALAQAAVEDVAASELLAAGAAVQLETGEVVWLSCVLHDRPTTPQIDFLTVAIACRDGLPWIKPNGQVVASVWWAGMWPEPLARIGIDTVRRALLMIALGEPQPQVDIPNPAEDGPTQMDALPIGDPAVHSIRTAITAAREIAAQLADVL